MLVLKGELYDLTVDTVNVAHAEHGFQIHHLHWLGVRLEEEKKPGLLAFSFTHVYIEIYIFLHKRQQLTLLYVHIHINTSHTYAPIYRHISIHTHIYMHSFVLVIIKIEHIKYLFSLLEGEIKLIRPFYSLYLKNTKICVCVSTLVRIYTTLNF